MGKIKLISLLVCTFFLQLSTAETFKVALSILSEFNPISNEINSVNYIGLHLYYPLFDHDKNGNTDSKFLDLSKTKSLSMKFNEYRLCLKNDLKFSDGSKIQSDDLQSSLSYLTELYPHLIVISKITNEAPLCVHLLLKRPTPNLFKKLTGIASTVLKKEYVKKPFPIGYGPYKISKTSSNRIFLSFNGNPSPRFDEIEFRSIKSNADIGQEQFHDFNQMPLMKNFIPDTSKSNFYAVPSLKVYSIVINLPTTKERQCVQKLLMDGQWQQSYGLSVIPQQSFLPWRIQQEAWLPKNITCAQTRKKIPFLIADIYDSKAISDEFSKIGATKYFDIISLPGADFAKWAFSGKPYVAMMSFDSSSSTA